jgi:hypothetical protein
MNRTRVPAKDGWVDRIGAPQEFVSQDRAISKVKGETGSWARRPVRGVPPTVVLRRLATGVGGHGGGKFEDAQGLPVAYSWYGH